MREEQEPQQGRPVTFELLKEIVASQAEKKQWKDQPVEDVVRYIGFEQQEALEAITEGQDTMHIAGELGDILYLTLRACHQLNIDPLKALQMKTVRNAMKYPHGRETEYDEYTAQAKQEWKMIGDDQFFKWWEEAIGGVEDVS